MRTRRTVGLGMLILALLVNRVSAHVSLVEREISSNTTLNYFRNGAQSVNDPHGSDSGILVSERSVPTNDNSGTLLFGRGLQDQLGFSALKSAANDEPITATEESLVEVRYSVKVLNEGPATEQMHMSFHIHPTMLHLYDQSVEGIGVPPGFAGFEQKAEIQFSIFAFSDDVGDQTAWQWFARLSGGKAGADNFTLLTDPSHIGEPTRLSPAPTAASELDADYDDFSAALDFGDLLPGKTFKMTYTIFAKVSLRGGHDSGPNGGSVIGGDPFDLTGDEAGSNFVFTAGDFSTASVPEPATGPFVLACAGAMSATMRNGRRRQTPDCGEGE